ncbi:hypothetical protein KDX30_01175 [Pseudomonas sp. CDFA 553]|uniref:hypothetical protein n=1 Tax=Pseudomonas quasicaspiana TaxID=2829821 RepID=UPI001E2B6A06|nr:hypothetical protein [Pseudomonas quasicaspiana]MCD5986502.1 hypothetical protein [Pseudomonas quasicaspiana]
MSNHLIYSRLHRYEGQLLYLQAARYGLYCFVTAMMLVGAAVYGFRLLGSCFGLNGSSFCIWGASYDILGPVADSLTTLQLVPVLQSAQVWAFLTYVAVVTIVIPAPGAHLVFLAVKALLGSWDHTVIQGFLLRESVKHSPLLNTLVLAFAKRSPVMITMNDRKVYVGYIKSMGDSTEVTGFDKDFELVPTLSGYRDKDTLEVRYTTEYESEGILNNSLFLKQENVVSLTLYNQDIRAAFEKTTRANVDWRD